MEIRSTCGVLGLLGAEKHDTRLSALLLHLFLYRTIQVQKRLQCMSFSEIAVKRIRRQWEPEEKTWNDEALQLPWEEVLPPLHSSTLFALRNVFFFSHATAVQARTINVLCSSGSSAIVEAPTGSGKTLAVLIPLMERTIRACDAFVAAHNGPLFRRDIIGIVLSPSRVLAEQTFVVGRNLVARLPHTIRFALCDGAVQTAEAVVKSLKAAARGAGTFLVTTPRDLVDFIAALGARGSAMQSVKKGGGAASGGGGLTDTTEFDERQQLLLEQDEETLRRYYEKRGGRGNVREEDTGYSVQLKGCHEERFVLVVDEADLIFNSTEMRGIVTEFVRKHGVGQQLPCKRPRGESGNIQEDSSTGCSASLLPMDISFVGATVSTSAELQGYAEEVCAALHTNLHKVILSGNEDFVTQLQNRYLLCEAHDFLPVFVQLMNMHSSKKHFIFFNSPKTLRFVEKLFSRLTETHHMLLCISHVFVMYEGMNERTRLDQYNAFLNHTAEPKVGAISVKKAAATSSEKRNQFYTSGWKREGRQPGGRGAILLCTDVAAFGLDVRDVDYVYHFEPPTTVQSYVHRIGRVGRMGMRGSSILVLPCFSTDGSLTQAPERKSTSTRFNTLTNTKSATSSLQAPQVSEDDLSEERRRYLKELGARSELQPCSIPPFAPIAATVRNVISQHNKLKMLAQQAAVSMCTAPSSMDGAKSWFDPKLALHALLLD